MNIPRRDGFKVAGFVLFLAAIALGLALYGEVAWGHEWYAAKKDPVTNAFCCNGFDCQELPPDSVGEVENGYHVVLSVEQAQAIRKDTKLPINAYVPRARVQPSHDGNFHACIMAVERGPPTYGIRCLFVPLSS